MTQEIKDLRLRIDGLSQLVIGLDGSPQLTKAHNGLLLGKAWLGKVLGALGTSSPYPKDGERKSVADIEPTADKVGHDVTKTVTGWGDKNHIEKIDWLRQQIGEVVKEDYIISHTYKPTDRLEAIARTNVYTHLSEARFWLGWELERIKNDYEK